MTVSFWIAAIAMGAFAAAFVILPVLLGNRNQRTPDRSQVNVDIYRERIAELTASLESADLSESEFEALKLEAEQALLKDVPVDSMKSDAEKNEEATKAGNGVTPYVVALLIPLFAFFAYSDSGLSWGSIADLELSQRIQTGNPHDTTRVNDNVSELAARLATQPDNDEGWFLLARSYMNLEDYERAAGAFKHLVDRYPQDVDLLTYYAQSLFLADARTVTPRVDEVIARTLVLDPNNLTMLEIRGIEHMAKRELTASLEFFRRAANEASGERAELINQAIETVETMMRSEGQAVPGAPDIRVIDVDLRVASSVRVDPSSAVFVFARAVTGPPMPLAVLRLRRSELPKSVRLTESMAMTAGMSLADFDEVEVIARISSTGTATSNPDDPEARSGPINLTGDVGVIALEIR